jgi:LPXTG-motif cell wall-anchored protein
MQRIAKKGLVLAAATGGLALSGVGYANADAGASGAATNSPGVLSGNVVQVPIHVPVNVCGNTVDIVALLNPAFGNKCENTSSHHHGRPGVRPHSDAPTNGAQTSAADAPAGDTAAADPTAAQPAVSGRHRASGHSGGGAGASGAATNSPGVLSGNVVQVPVDIPVNVCGNTINIIGLLNPTFGNTCVNHEGQRHHGGDIGGPGTGLTGGGPGGDIGGPGGPGGDIGGPGGDIGGPGGDIGGPGGPVGDIGGPGGPGGDIGGPGGDIGGPGGPVEAGGPSEPAGSLASTGMEGMLIAPVGGALLLGGLVTYRRFRTRAQG